MNRPRKRLSSEYISTVEEIFEEMIEDTEKVGKNNCEYEKII